jgi:hypothetical protein
MELLLAWALFPAVMLAVCAGCGLAYEALTRATLPTALVPVCGLAVIIVVGQFLTLADATAELTTPVIAAVAVVGFGVAWLERRRVKAPPALLVALIGVFAVYAAPIVLSGDATLAGFVKLDDTATWLAFTDHVMEHGRDLDGLAPSSYEATLAVNIGDGYPIGAFIPLGVATQLLGADPSILIQPFMAFVAVLLAAAFWVVAAPIVASPRWRAALVFLAAQPALLLGYYLWGGIKEVLAAALIASAAGIAAWAVERAWDRGPTAGLVLLTGALVGVLSIGGLVWMGPLLLVVVCFLWWDLDLRELAVRVVGAAAGIALLALPVIATGGLLPPTSSPLSDSEAKGNLIEPLDPLQVAGVWPVGDFRLSPGVEPLSYGISLLALLLAVIGVVEAWRRRAVAAMCLTTGGIVGCLALTISGSPWVDGKALATASSIGLLLAGLGVAFLAELRPRWPAALIGAAVGVGVLVSTALAYRDVSLAPHEQFAELEEIGELVAGEGPSLMTEYSPYGVRHFLRDSDAEGVSELRRRPIPTVDGGSVEKGLAADTDELEPDALGVYRTLVLRRSPTQSRPPAAYELVWSGSFYEVWQRRVGVTDLPERLPLGSVDDPTGMPDCGDVERLAEGSQNLVAARRRRPIVIPLGGTRHPRDWSVPGRPESVLPAGDGTVATTIDPREDGEYEFWLKGSVFSTVELVVDGEPVNTVRHELNNEGGYIRLGAARLGPGADRIELRFSGSDLHPGSGGRQTFVGPLALSTDRPADAELVRVAAVDALELCERRWDWIEAAR